VRLLSFLLLLVPATASADGWLSMRGAYYKERATRVRQPMIDAVLDAGDKGTVAAHLLVDEITSASSATGSQMGAFTELRYEAGLGYTHDLGHMRVGGNGRYSVESDYFSGFLSGHLEVDLFERNTTLRLVSGLGSDTITNNVQREEGAIGTPFVERSLLVLLSSVGVTQILSRRLVASFIYDFMAMDGYQANLYRVVHGGTSPVAERVPSLRLRHALFAGLRAYVAPTRSTVFLGYRLYADTWDVIGHTPEVRLVQPLTDGLEVRLSYRMHTQTAAFFFQDLYTQGELADPGRFVTEDEKLSAFSTHTFGLLVSGEAGLLGISGSMAELRVELAVERILQDTAFGDAWTAQLGVVVPVRY
jgi:hypothetical protein